MSGKTKSLRQKKPIAECKVSFLGKWTVSAAASEQVLTSIQDSISPNGGIKTKLRVFENGLKIGEKQSMFATFPEQNIPMQLIKSLKRDEKNTNTLILIVITPANMHEIMVYRCPTEYESRQILDAYEQHKVPVAADYLTTNGTQVNSQANWSMTQTTAARFPRTAIATPPTVNNTTTQVTVNDATKTMYIKQQEPIYATVNKKKTVDTNASELQERVKILEEENRRLRNYISQNVVTTYQAVPVKDTEVPIDGMILVEGNHATNITNGNSGLVSSSQINGGDYVGSSVYHSSRPVGSLHGGDGSVYSSGSFAHERREATQTRFLVPVQTLRRNVRSHTHVERKIDQVYKAKKPSMTAIAAPSGFSYERTSDSLPPMDSMSSLSSGEEDNILDGNPEMFEINTPTEVRYM